MGSRRDFIKKAGILAGGTGLWSGLPPSIQKAIAINPGKGTTFRDAEHVVLLMQENRSFDHVFGTLQGVRGFNDPRAITLPDGNQAWLQSDAKGRTFAPFRLDIKDTRATWMSSLPHSWASQVDARNSGRHDNWLEAKRSGNSAYADMPLTLGYYNRGDLPFYYALADAFTVCDQHFCSSLTGTTPNRLFYWTGTIRERPSGTSPANVDNADVDYHSPAGWKTFPERLEDLGISWKVYQNELSVGVGFAGQEDPWLANFTDNPLEWFSSYQVRFLPAHVRWLQQKAASLSAGIGEMEKTGASPGDLQQKKQELSRLREEAIRYSRENFLKLPERERRLHERAFTTNLNDPDYHELTALSYREGNASRRMEIPKGDVLYQFRRDVAEGGLPTVSWLVAPENFSDHPSAPWYGAWYLSEVLDILTGNPEIWKKTIFILTYDENDGYFDHVPPFTAPDPGDPATGKYSPGTDTTVEYVTEAQARALKGTPKDPGRVSPIGLGYRVPFVVASPWSRGGWVNSQVFDHTSVLMFLEKFLSGKTGKPVRENNISAWRRTVCGDLSSIFRPYDGEKTPPLPFVRKKPFLESIYNARFKGLPSGFTPLSEEQVTAANEDPASSPFLPRQEPGIRPSCALPYQLYADGEATKAGGPFVLRMRASDEAFGREAAGGPFTVYDMHGFRVRNYAVAAGEELADEWPLTDGGYHLRLYGPNGFYREFRGMAGGPLIRCHYEQCAGTPVKLSGNLELQIANPWETECRIQVSDYSFHTAAFTHIVPPRGSARRVISLKESHGWYDIMLNMEGKAGFLQRYAGRVETGRPSYTDPFMGRDQAKK